MTKKKKLTFRQRLRLQSETKLADLKSKARDAIIQVLIDNNANLAADDLMRAMSTSQNKTLDEHLVTHLANQCEDELEALYNKQIELIPEEKTDGKA